MTVVNLTPHPIRVYARDVPDRIDRYLHDPVWTFEPSGVVARIGEIDLGTQYLRNCEVPVEYVEYRHVNGLPERREDVWLIVPLALALALPDRGDLLVPYREVRNHEGTVIGCRQFARPV